MSIPEASQLILQAGAIGQGGEVFILDMGEPVKILDLAEELIRLSGLEPGDDIPIKITGARPGEKKVEELSLASENLDQTKHDKIFVLKDSTLDIKSSNTLLENINILKNKLKLISAEEIKTELSNILPDYTPNLSLSRSSRDSNIDKAEA